MTSEQEQLEQELDFINSQQNDLESTLKKLEDDIDKMPLNSGHQQQRTDTSRIEMYKLLIEVDNQLRGMSSDLKEVINRLNDTNVDLNDPTTQISKILNAHMDSLNWIEDNTSKLNFSLSLLLIFLSFNLISFFFSLLLFFLRFHSKRGGQIRQTN